MENNDYQQLITIAIVDDLVLYRDPMVASLQGLPDMRVLFIATEEADLLRKLEESGVPHMVLLDIRLAVGNGYRIAAWLRENQPGVHILMLSDITDPDGIREAFDCGAHGFVSKDQPFDELVAAIREVHRTGRYRNPLLDGGGIPTSRFTYRQRFVDLLTPELLGVLGLAAEGKSNAEIAGEMNMAVATVKKHLSNLFDWFGTHSRSGLARKAADMGLLPRRGVGN